MMASRRVRWAAAACAGALLFTLPLIAQEKPDAPQPKPNATQNPGAPSPRNSIPPAEQTPAGEKGRSTKRILGIIPNFQTTDVVPQDTRPLTTREKYTLAWHQMADFSAHFGNAFQSMLAQASDGQPHFGQGWDSYAARFGASEGDQITSSLFIFGVYPAVFKQDPRYFRRGTGSAWWRVKYSASRTFITRTDSGRSAFNTSQVLGQLTQAGISNAYYPAADRGAKGTFEDCGIGLAYTSGYNVLKEYYPDLLHYIFHRRKKRAEPAPDSNP
jgi:hypothetical protein